MMWKKLMENNAECISDEGRDDQALYMHYRIHHRNHLQKSAFALWDAFRVIFIEKPPIYLLDSKEDYWISKVNAGINIKNGVAPTRLWRVGANWSTKKRQLAYERFTANYRQKSYCNDK